MRRLTSIPRIGGCPLVGRKTKSDRNSERLGARNFIDEPKSKRPGLRVLFAVNDVEASLEDRVFTVGAGVQSVHTANGEKKLHCSDMVRLVGWEGEEGCLSAKAGSFRTLACLQRVLTVYLLLYWVRLDEWTKFQSQISH